MKTLDVVLHPSKLAKLINVKKRKTRRPVPHRRKKLRSCTCSRRHEREVAVCLCRESSDGTFFRNSKCIIIFLFIPESSFTTCIDNTRWSFSRDTNFCEKSSLAHRWICRMTIRLVSDKTYRGIPDCIDVDTRMCACPVGSRSIAFYSSRWSLTVVYRCFCSILITF